jgi:hypothetical protein
LSRPECIQIAPGAALPTLADKVVECLADGHVIRLSSTRDKEDVGVTFADIVSTLRLESNQPEV